MGGIMNSVRIAMVLLFFSILFNTSLQAQDSFFNALSVLKKDAGVNLNRHISFIDEFMVQKHSASSFMDLYKEFIYQEWTDGDWNNTFSEKAFVDTTGEEWTWTSENFIYLNDKWSNYEKYVVITTPFTEENPKLLSSSSYVWVDDNRWVEFSRISYTYKDNLLTEALIELAIGENTFMPLQLYTYEYNELELVSAETISDNEGSGWMLSFRKTYDYNDMGMLTGTREMNRRNDAWEDSMRTAIEYNMYDLVSDEFEYVYSGDKEIPYRRIKYAYDVDMGGRLTSEVMYMWENDDWAVKTFLTYDYDENNLLVSLTTEEHNGTGFILKERERYSYNENRLETERITETFNGSGWENYARVLTIYTISSVEDDLYSPEAFRLYSNYPNPFNPVTTISYSIPSDTRVMLKVFNALGEEVRTLVNEEQSAGLHKISFQASNLPSGIYFYTITAGNISETRKMILMK
jgi:hypothetical protein